MDLKLMAEEIARLQAELDAARKERDEERNAHAELQARCYDYGGTGQNVFSDLANLRAINEQYVNMDALKDSQLAALRTRLERAPPREPTEAMVRAQRGWVGITDEVARNIWRRMYDAAIDTAATQGGAK